MIGSEQPEAEIPSRSGGSVFFGNFEVVAAAPLQGGVRMQDYERSLQLTDQETNLLAFARRQLQSAIGEENSVRALRLKAGISQSDLALRVLTTQAHIANIEAGKVDPATDMVARLAVGLGISSDQLFVAIRKQRALVAESA